MKKIRVEVSYDPRATREEFREELIKVKIASKLAQAMLDDGVVEIRAERKPDGRVHVTGEVMAMVPGEDKNVPL